MRTAGVAEADTRPELSGLAPGFAALPAGPRGRAVVFLGGLGASAGAALLTEFARSLRARLGLRPIAVERNGFGEAASDPAPRVSDAVDDVLAVLAAIGVERRPPPCAGARSTTSWRPGAPGRGVARSAGDVARLRPAGAPIGPGAWGNPAGGACHRGAA
jgi:pimeloyl-ACP methyl ester carboxylesterase